MKKVYVFVATQNEGEPVKVKRTARGFNSFEVLGFVEMSRQEIIDMINGVIKPNVITKARVIKGGRE